MPSDPDNGRLSLPGNLVVPVVSLLAGALAGGGAGGAMGRGCDCAELRDLQIEVRVLQEQSATTKEAVAGELRKVNATLDTIERLMEPRP